MKARIDLVLTVIGPDRPGLVELVSRTVTRHQGNWESSRMARMAFATSSSVSLPRERTSERVAWSFSERDSNTQPEAT